MNERKLKQDEIKRNTSDEYQQHTKKKPKNSAIDLLLDLSQTDPTLTEDAVLNELNLFIIAVSLIAKVRTIKIKEIFS